MNDIPFDSFVQTGEVVAELQAKARESAARGESRRSFLEKAAVLGGTTALGASAFNVLSKATASAATAGFTCDCTAHEIVSLADTAELLAVTFYFNALTLPTSMPDINNRDHRNYFQAAMIHEWLHHEFLETQGAKPLATSFFFPQGMFTDEKVFFSTVLDLEFRFIGAYIASTREFSGVVSSNIRTPNPFAIGASAQIMGVECEHRALIRDVAGLTPPDNVQWEPVPEKCVKEVIATLKPFITGGSGFTGPFPLPTKADVNTRAMPFGFGFFPPIPIV